MGPGAPAARPRTRVMSPISLAGRAALALLLATAATAQPTLEADASVGPSLTTLGASGAVEAVGLEIPVGRVDFPTSVGLDARVRVGLRGPVWGARLGAGYLSASDVFDGASIVGREGVDVAFVLTSAEVTARQPLGSGEAVLGVGPELRVVLDEGDATEGLLSVLGDVRRSHVAVGGSLGARFRVPGLVLGPELRAGLALTPISDDQIEAFGGALRLRGDFRLDHVSLSLTVGVDG